MPTTVQIAGVDGPIDVRVDADADNEIARHSLRGRYGQVLTHLDLDEIDPWS